MKLRRSVALGAGVAAAGSLAYVVQRSVAGRWRVGAEEIAAAGLTLPPDLHHHFVETSDGGRVHAVERTNHARGPSVNGGGRAHLPGPTFVLLHGITLGVATWAPQLRSLGGRVIAVSLRGHGQSRAGSEGYSFERLGADVLEVMDALDVGDAVVVAHSMGGMIAQLLAVTRPDELARRVRRLVLVSTAAGPLPVSALSAFVGALATRLFVVAERRGLGPFPRSTTIWAARVAFGADPAPAAVELLRGMIDAMSPAALAALLPNLLAFDVRNRLGAVQLPTHVIVGTRDVLTPPRTARALAEHLPGGRLTLLAGCGHMVMLERAEALCDLLN